MSESKDPDARRRAAWWQAEVARTRGGLKAARHDARHDTAGRIEEQRLRAELLAALEGYAGALDAAGAPMPYQLRAELELYRSLEGR